MKIDPSLQGKLSQVGKPEPFAGKDGQRQGWKVTIPGGRPLATPAVVQGRVFLGGGFGSYEFFAFDAFTGNVVWQYQTEDDGPTAAVVADDCVVFNTESCELEVLSTAGRRLWKMWLGDPLLSMPAVAQGRVFMAYPDTRADRRHYLACFGLRDGRELWRTPIAGEIITCPVLADGHVYLTNLDGTLGCFRQEDGQSLWQEARNATSAPAVWNKQCYFSQRSEQQRHKGGTPTTQQMEILTVKVAAAGTKDMCFEATSSEADYLDHDKRQRRSPHYKAYDLHDAGVGFGFSKGDSKMHQAMNHLGHSQVSAIWAYQGSKPFVSAGRVYSGLGDTVHCADPASKDVHWKRKLRPEESTEELLDSLLTPPAIVNGKLFLGTLDGRVLCLAEETGETLWSEELGAAVLFQPAVAQGRVYVTTATGQLYCLDTGDPGDDGWLMWGATPEHNGLVHETVGA